MRDLLTLDRIQIEHAERGPFIVVGAPQADSIKNLLQSEQVEFNVLAHDYTDDVMFALAPEVNTVFVQTLLDQVE